MPARLDLLRGALEPFCFAHVDGETGSRHPALHRPETKGCISDSWKLSHKGQRAGYYRLTSSGPKQPASEQSKGQAFSRAIGLILQPADEETS